MYIKTALFQHLKWLNKAVAKVQGEAFMNSSSLVVELRVGNKVFTLYPMFIMFLNGKKVYSHQFNEDSYNFAGWKPYYNRATPELGKKLTFKSFVQQHALLTPDFSLEQGEILKDVIVKMDISSFGSEIKGPFADTSMYQLDKDSGEYFEVFTPGDIIKIWYWNDRPVVMESQPMPSVTGDGQSTIRELVKQYHFTLKSHGKIDWDVVRALITYQGSDLDGILPEGVSRLIDFRYISAFSVPANITSVQLTRGPTDEHSDLYRLGQVIHSELHTNGQTDTIYSVDAILDREGHYRFLEVNFNPAIHPCVYPDMVESLTAGNVYRELRRDAGVAQIS